MGGKINVELQILSSDFTFKMTSPSEIHVYILKRTSSQTSVETAEFPVLNTRGDRFVNLFSGKPHFFVIVIILFIFTLSHVDHVTNGPGYL